MKQWTIIGLIEWTKDYLEKYGVPNPRLDAELLLSHTLKLKRIDLYLNHGRVLTENELKEFKSYIQRRATREPLQYITGVQEFFGIPIKVSPGVFIPRPETELLVESILKNIEKDAPLLILDLGTGSGAILAALAKELPRAHLVGIDSSEEAVNIARTNLEPWRGRTELLCGDLFTALKGPKQFDIIVSNPPYIPPIQKANLQPEVSKYEPADALFTSSEDGLDFFKKIINDAHQFLNNGGLLAMEIGLGQSDDIINLFSNSKLYDNVEVIKDYNKIERVILARKKYG